MSLVYDKYTTTLAVIEQIGQGRTLTFACDEAGVSVPAFRKYVEANEQLRGLFQDAEQRSYDAMADALVNIDNHKIHGQSDAKMAKVISDNIKWLLSKRRQKEYGERLEIKHELTMDRAITDALNAARSRTGLALPFSDVIDGIIVEDDDTIMRELLR